ncbi:MAG: toll/interleukin-1 receptor domain-containing protein, partial [Phycisphaeraceae bacterium]
MHEPDTADKQPEPSDLFISYAHADNADGWVTAFVEAIKQEFRAFSGRELAVFFDTDAIENMQDWELRILKGLKQAKVMLAVLSPAYVASAYCQKEWRIFIEHEIARAMLDQGGIANLYYVTVPGVMGGEPDPKVAAWLRDMNRRQIDAGCDARAWRDGGREALQRDDVRQRLRKLSQQIERRIQLVGRVIDSPTTVPPYNPKFVGRVEDLSNIRHTLEENTVGAIVGVQGIGGIGKSELAFTYAHAYADTYPGGRFMISCEGVDDMRQALVRLDGINDYHGNVLFQLSLDDKRDLDRAAAVIRNQIVGRGRCLLILDNVNRPELLAPAVRDRVLPDRRHLHVLVTSREEPSRLTGVICLAVDALETADAVRLLEQHRPFADDAEMKAATAIVNLLGGHPLACEVVAVHLREHPKITCAQYLVRMSKDLMEALGGAGGDAKVALARNPAKFLGPLLAPTLESLQGAASCAIDFASFMHPDQVPLPWLRDLVQAAHPDLLPTVEPGHDDPWDDAVARLIGLRLLTPLNKECRPPIVRIHRLLQLVIHAQGDPQTNAQLMSQQQARVDHYVRSRAADLRNVGHERDRQWEIQPVEWYARHRLADPAAVEAAVDIANAISGPMGTLGRYSEQRKLLLDANDACAAAFEAGDPRLAPGLSNLAGVEKALGNLPEAKRLYLRAIEITAKHFDADHPNLAAYSSNLAGVESQLGNLPEAKRLYLRAIEIE